MKKEIKVSNDIIIPNKLTMQMSKKETIVQYIKIVEAFLLLLFTILNFIVLILILNK